VVPVLSVSDDLTGSHRLHNNRIIKFRGYVSVDMQLPRGSFHANKKGIRLVQLLKDLSGEGFTGYCILISGQLSATLVLKGGVPILASAGTLTGEDAVGVIRTLGEGTIDASISGLNDAQLRLAVEFNPSARLGKNRLKTRVESHNESGKGKQASPVPSPDLKPPGKHDAATGSPGDRTKPIPGPQSPRNRTAGARGEGRTAQSGGAAERSGGGNEIQVNIQNSEQKDEIVPEEISVTLVEHELAALEAMDLEAMCSRIRENCRTTVKGLQLEHLIQERSESSGDGRS
jgi:hypothetical protein